MKFKFECGDENVLIRKTDDGTIYVSILGKDVMKSVMDVRFYSYNGFEKIIYNYLKSCKKITVNGRKYEVDEMMEYIRTLFK